MGGEGGAGSGTRISNVFLVRPFTTNPSGDDACAVSTGAIVVPMANGSILLCKNTAPKGGERGEGGGSGGAMRVVRRSRYSGR